MQDSESAANPIAPVAVDWRPPCARCCHPYAEHRAYQDREPCYTCAPGFCQSYAYELGDL